jgi:hypothetical protein
MKIPRPYRAGAILGVAASLVCAAIPSRGTAQTESVVMKVDADSVVVRVHLDSMGVRPAPGADSTELSDFLSTQSLQRARALPGGTWVVMSGLMASASSAVARGRQLRAARPDLVADAGPLAHPSGSRLAFLYVDRVLVLFQPGTPGPARAGVEANFHLQRLFASPTNQDLVVYRFTDATPGGYFQTVGQLTAESAVRWAYPDYLEGAVDAFTPNDTYYPDQWHLGGGGVGSIDAEHAWDLTKGDPSVVIATIENYGYDLSQEDLEPNFWADPGDPTVHGWNFKLCGISGSPPCGNPDVDDFTTVSHGTFVAGLAAARGDNGKGVTGVCFLCRIMMISTGSFESGRVMAFSWAEAHGASVINASWDSSYDPAVAWAIGDVALNSRGGQGVPVVFAAGNDGNDVCQEGARTMGAAPGAYLVGATDDKDLSTSWSNWGDCVDLVAPGGTMTDMVSMVSTDPMGDGLLNADEVGSGGCTAEISGTFDYTRCAGGTSASAPLVAGTVGLMLSVNPDLNSQTIYEILNRTAEKVSCADAKYGGSTTCPTSWMDRSDHYGYGSLDAFEAVQEAQPPSTTCPTLTCPTCPGCPTAGSGTGGTGAWEAGARLGYTRLTGTTAETLWGAPGSGPMGDAALYLARRTSGPGTWLWLWELQVGSQRHSQPAPAGDETVRTLAAQVNLLIPLGGYQAYSALNLAYRRWDDGMGTITDPTAWGAAAGIRRVLVGHLPVRLEGRWRSWSDGTHEVGVALVLGVLF